MKLILIGLLALTAFGQKQCNKKTSSAACYKGRLETKAICSNYTLTVLEGNIDAALVDASWTNEQTGKTYKNAFGIGNPCNFPATIAEGQEFYFTIDTTGQPCATCKAYYPTPSKKLSIKVLVAPCQ